MFDESRLASENGVSSTVKIKDWILLDLLSFLNIIPIVGSIAYIVILCVIGFGSKSAISMKNRVIASLIWMAVGIVLSLLFLFAFGGLAMLASVGNGGYSYSYNF